MIAVPDFAATAMENWGLITYSEPSSLFDEESSSNVDQQFIAILIVHELAHQVWPMIIIILYRLVYVSHL